MPYSRKSYSKKTNPTWNRKVAKVVRKTLKKVVEPKTKALSSQTPTITTTGLNLTHACQIAEGTTQSERIGNQVYLNSFYWKGHVLENSSSTAGTRTRFILYKPRDNDSRLAVGVDDEVELDEFIVMKDFIVTTDPAKPHAPVTVSWKGNTKLIYTSTTETSWTSSIYILYIVSDRSAISQPPSFYYRFRNKFRDL